MGGTISPVDLEEAQDTLLNAEQAASMKDFNSAKGETALLPEKTLEKRGKQRKLWMWLIGGLLGLAAVAAIAVGVWLKAREPSA